MLDGTHRKETYQLFLVSSLYYVERRNVHTSCTLSGCAVWKQIITKHFFSILADPNYYLMVRLLDYGRTYPLPDFPTGIGLVVETAHFLT
jgi:hypothetical protein